MYRSRSLQSASAEFPRVIVYGENDSLYDLKNRLIIAFSGKSGEPGYDKLEVIGFDDRSKEFRFSEVSFPAESGKADQNRSG